MNTTSSQKYNVPNPSRGHRSRGPARRPAPVTSKYDWMHPSDGDDEDAGLRPTPLFPDADIQPPAPLSGTEKDQVKHFLALRKRIHDGPIYAIIGNTSHLERYATFKAAQVDPFEGAPTYSSIYKKQKRTLPQLDTRTYEKQFFPRELWPILKTNSKLPNGASAQSKGKRKVGDDNVDGEAADTVRKRARLRRINRVIADDEDEDAQRGQEDLSKLMVDSDDEPEEGEEIPDEFSDEDDTDDYNAEKYFQNGSDNEDQGGDDGDGYDDTF